MKESRRRIKDLKSQLEGKRGDLSMLGICPMSEEIVRASFREAERKDFAPMFVATPRQVDADRGYTGWSQKELVKFLRSTAEDEGYESVYLLARDHGGPYQSVRDRDDPKVSLNDAMKYAKELFAEDVRAGFDIVHVDATEDPTVEGALDLNEVADRTVELISSIEKVREEEDLSGVHYEVGTEEITGGMTRPEEFERFINLLKSSLSERKLNHVEDRLLFIVGQVGTTMRIDMTNKFEFDQAEKLVKIASQGDLFLKVHYTDWLDDSILEEFPKLGVGGANVGPEFAASLVEALEVLEGKEKSALEGVNKGLSKMMDSLEWAAIRESPWQRFAPEEMDDQELAEFAQDHSRKIAICVGRYVMNNPEVVSSRRKLYQNIEEHTSVEDPHELVIENIRESISRYVKAFNLPGSAKKFE
ncbi:hypothetical protein AKJ57_03895 [candidate division MSBL1 archaeon SCGC-AAA259A05]|uniref:Tagatose-6-phosphate kinase n=1 Tax=candidate division MSBL1 archaeon SCGC-AAA259A05 TaxID=1698259 RepID=A0A133U984_9EURY|nr:hypothetical protein AKJ57_03895 [candidate division MSBL1 archaeon SCGC-AAA259A05]